MRMHEQMEISALGYILFIHMYVLKKHLVSLQQYIQRNYAVYYNKSSLPGGLKVLISYFQY